MEGIFNTFHDFMVHTKSVIYILIIVALAGLAWWWGFLTEGDEDDHPKG